MPRPAVFFDRDNTLIANSDYLGDPEGVILLEGAAAAVARVRAMGFVSIVVSNQSGVARGMFTEDDVRAVNRRMDQMLIDAHPDALIEGHEFSPHHPDAIVDEYRGDDRRRKPQPGMIIDAAAANDLDLARSWLIGDAPRDIEAGHRAGCRTILVREKLGSISIAAKESMRIAPDYIATSLEDAVDFIEMHHETSPETSAAATSVAEPDEAVNGTLAERLIATMDPPPVTIAPPVKLEPISLSAHSEIASDGFVSSSSTPSTPHATTSVSSALGAMKAAITSSAPPANPDKQTVMLLERIVEELRRGNDPPQDFSVAKMLAGIVQGFALATLFAALLARDAGGTTFSTLMMLAIFLQAMVASLALLGR